MNNPDLEEIQTSSQTPSDTPPQDTEQEVVQHVAEEVVSESGLEKDLPRAKVRGRTSTHKKPPAAERTPPKVSGIFLGEEDKRILETMNKVIMKRLGIKKNNSFRV
jgi:hypothetical protein